MSGGAMVPFSVYYGLYGQTSYQRIRIPVPPKPLDTTEQKPGYLCWGDAGTLPTPTPAVGPHFEMKQDQVHDEVERKETLTRIQNPDNPDQYIMVNRADYLIFKTTNRTPTPWPTSNTSTQSNFNDPNPIKPPDPSLSPPGTASYFIPLSNQEIPASTPGSLRVNFKNTPATL